MAKRPMSTYFPLSKPGVVPDETTPDSKSNSDLVEAKGKRQDLVLRSGWPGRGTSMTLPSIPATRGEQRNLPIVGIMTLRLPN